MSDILGPPTEGVSTPPTDYEMYLDGTEDGEVQIICDHPSCMRQGRTTPTNPRGLWLQDVGALPYRPNALQVIEAWWRHIADAHGLSRPGGDA